MIRRWRFSKKRGCLTKSLKILSLCRSGAMRESIWPLKVNMDSAFAGMTELISNAELMSEQKLQHLVNAIGAIAV